VTQSLNTASDHRRMTLRLLTLVFLAFSPGGVLQAQTKAPELRLKDLNGRTVRLSDYRGKVVLINFWATWCPPCRAEMPDLIKLQREHRKDGLQIIGITYPNGRPAYGGLPAVSKLTTL
jgi:thiol-disulfide isomerase/thioredoxin